MRNWRRTSWALLFFAALNTLMPSLSWGRQCSSLLTSPAAGAALLESKVPGDIREALELSFTLMEQHYAPLKLKELTIGLNWEAAKKEYRERVAKAQSTREVMLIFSELFHLMDDTHVNPRLYSSRTFMLPLQILHTPNADGTRGPLVLNHISQSYLKFLDEHIVGAEGSYSLKKLPELGDEILRIQGKAPEEFFRDLGGISHTNGNPLTNYSYSAMGLTRLRERSGVDLQALENILTSGRVITFTLQRPDGETYNLAISYLKYGIGLVDFIFAKDGQEIRYPEGVSPYDPTRVYVPTLEDAGVEKQTAGEGLTLGTLYHQAKTLVRTYSQALKETAEELAIRANPNFRAFEKLFTRDMIEHPAFASALEASDTVRSLFNLGSEVHDYSYHAPQIDERGQLVMESEEESSPGALNLGHFKPLVKLPENFERIRPPAPFRHLLNDTSFFAGTFEHNGKKVGYLRVPSYQPATFETLQFSIRYFLGRLEQESDYLIFDQINNPGGWVAFSDMLVKGFTGGYDHDRHMKFAIRPTYKFLRRMPSMLVNLEQMAAMATTSGLFRGQLLDEAEVHRLLKGFDEDKQKVYRVLDPDYRANKSKPYSVFEDELGLTEPISLSRVTEITEMTGDRVVWDLLGDPENAPASSRLYNWLRNTLGVDILNPRVQYTKPIYMWINELDVSGGDATPAVLQDLGRVKLIGVRTAGAGGTVHNFEITHAGETDLEVSLTTSLMVRNRPNPQDPWWVENEGVHPDIPFAITPEDVRTGYEGTLARLLEIIEADL